MAYDIKLKIAKVGYITISIILCVLSAVVVSRPITINSNFCIVCGVVLIIFGFFKLMGFFSNDLYCLAFQYDLAFGILLIALGIIVIARLKTIESRVVVILGICILSDSLLRIQTSLESKSFGISNWWIILLLSIATGICGFLLTLQPSNDNKDVSFVLGFSLFFEGLLNLATTLLGVSKNTKCVRE